jgi:hypothetical protein
MDAHFRVILVGIIATVVLDLWTLIVKHVLNGPTTNWALVGRWVGHLGRGVFVHRPIANSPEIAGELTLGWAFHYLIGVAYSYLYLFALSLLSAEISMTSAIVFGLVTVVAAWFVLQPGLGVGFFARLAPRPWLVRALNLSSHFFFGCGLYLGWRVLGN